MTATRNARREMLGVVMSAKTPKTIVVEVVRTFKHGKYGKFMRRRKRYMAHDEEQIAKVGDVVEIASTRPLSKRKRWRFLRVLKHIDLAQGIEGELDSEIGGSRP